MLSASQGSWPTARVSHHVWIVMLQVEAADRAREAEELRQQLSSGAQHADALAAAQSQVHDLEQQLSQVQAALQQETSRAQEALQVCAVLCHLHMCMPAIREDPSWRSNRRLLGVFTKICWRVRLAGCCETP